MLDGSEASWVGDGCWAWVVVPEPAPVSPPWEGVREAVLGGGLFGAAFASVPPPVPPLPPTGFIVPGLAWGVGATSGWGLGAVSVEFCVGPVEGGVGSLDVADPDELLVSVGWSGLCSVGGGLRN